MFETPQTDTDDFYLGQMYIDRMTDIHAVCGVVKYWFRVLPDSVIPESYFDSIVEAASMFIIRFLGVIFSDIVI